MHECNVEICLCVFSSHCIYDYDPVDMNGFEIVLSL